MEFIDTSDTEKFDRVVAAGIDLVQKLREVLTAHGLGEEEALGVLLVGSGGVLLTTAVTPLQYVQDLIGSCQLWYCEGGSDRLGDLRCALDTHREIFEAKVGEN